jgi:hypothetical protein
MEPPFHPTRRPSPGGDKTDLDDIKLTPIDSGISAEHGEPLIKEFRLAKFLCNDGYKVQMRLPTNQGERRSKSPVWQQESFVRKILE